MLDWDPLAIVQAFSNFARDRDNIVAGQIHGRPVLAAEKIIITVDEILGLMGQIRIQKN